MLRFLLLFLLPGLLQAHQIAEMTMDLEPGPTGVRATIQADAAYMLPEFRGDEDEEAKDLAWLRARGPEGWQRIEREASAYLKDCLTLLADGKELPWTLSIPALQHAEPPFLRTGEPEELPMLDVEIRAALPTGADKLEVQWREPFGVVLIVTTGGETKPVISGERVTVAEGGGEEMRAAPQSPADWIRVGFEHILPAGPDHILFVLGLFLLVPKWKPLLGQTLVFTLAHSLTLAAATLGWVHLPGKPVEILIAASIAWVGIENLCTKELGKGRLLLVGIFGLVHGLGFAGVLAEILPEDRPDKLAGALLGFNAGVELGQIAVLAIAFACFAWWGSRFVWVKRAGSVLVALAGLVLVIERAAEVEILPFL